MTKKHFLILLFPTLMMADQITMKNGDRITGVIIKKDGGKLVVKSEVAGDIGIAWDQIISITSDKPVYVALPSGKTVQGTIATSDGKLTVAGETVELKDVAAIRDEGEQKAWAKLQKPGFGDLWAGNGTLGFAGTKGNAQTQTFTLGLTAARATLHDKTSLYFNAIKASAFADGKNSNTAQAVRGGVGYSRNVGPRAFVNVFNDYEYDKFQNLDLRFVLGGGAGFKVINNARMHFDLLAGIAYNHEKFGTPLTRNSAEFYWGDDFSYKLNSITTLTHSYRMFDNLSDLGAYRINFDVGATTKLRKWLTWNIALSDRYLSNPAVGRKKNDFLYTTGLGFTFAR